MMVALEKGAKGGCPHPKLRVAQELLRKHFAEHAAAAAAEAAAAGGGGVGGAGPSTAAGGGGTRAMVFTSYRESVNELVPLLAQIEGVRPTKFIGQASSGVGENGRGLKQKEQRAVVREFEKGTHNVRRFTSRIWPPHTTTAPHPTSSHYHRCSSRRQSARRGWTSARST